MGNSPVLRAFYRKYPYSKKYAKYRKYALGGGKGGVEEASLARGAGG